MEPFVGAQRIAEPAAPRPPSDDSLGHTEPHAQRCMEERGGRKPLRIPISDGFGPPHVAARRPWRLAEVMTRRAPALARLLVVVAMAVLAASCSDDDGGAVASDSTTTSTVRRSTTTTTADPTEALKEEVEAAYIASSRAFIDAAAIPDPNFPALAATHTGPMLEQRREVLLGLQGDGRIIRYAPNSQYRIDVTDVEIDGDVARLEVCGVDDGETVVVSSGEVVAGGLGTVQARAAMRRIDGTWRLAERVLEAEWEGIAGCAAG
jgi:hypothetical protein